MNRNDILRFIGAALMFAGGWCRVTLKMTVYRAAIGVHG